MQPRTLQMSSDELKSVRVVGNNVDVGGSGGGTVRYETALSLGLRRHSKRINVLTGCNMHCPAC
jgi:hypothetical protein